MDPQNSTSFKEELDKIELALARKLLDELQGERTTYEEAREIAQTILMKLENVTDMVQLKIVLHDLATQWSMFNDISKIEEVKHDESMTKDQQIEDIRSKLSKFMQVQ